MMDLEYWRGHINGVILTQYRQYIQGRVSDWGCGAGYITRIIAESPKVDSVLGIDIDDSKFPEKTSKMSFSKEDICHLNYVKAFDTIVSFHTLEHVIAPLSAIRNMFRAMDTGFVIISVPYGRAYFNPDHRHFFTVQDIVSLLTKVGFIEIECYHDRRVDVHGDQHDCVTGLFLKRKASE